MRMDSNGKRLVFGMLMSLVCFTASAQVPHSADVNKDWKLSHEELLKEVELWAAGEYHVDVDSNYIPGPKPEQQPGESITVELPGLYQGAKPLQMALIPAGTFLMGAEKAGLDFFDPSDDELDADDDEGPIHKVTITKPFYMGTYEVTQAQWMAVMGSSPVNPPSDDVGANKPVVYVNWNDCQAFIDKLNTMGLGEFRLPTEAEWEYACRAGTTTPFYWGKDETQAKNYAWYKSNASGIKEVGQKKPNAWGLFDMSGNVYEWCQDRYGLYSSEEVVDPTGPQSGSYRVFRGGAWHYALRYCRSALRGRGSPGYRDGYVGVRLLRSYP